MRLLDTTRWNEMSGLHAGCYILRCTEHRGWNGSWKVKEDGQQKIGDRQDRGTKVLKPVDETSSPLSPSWISSKIHMAM